MKDHSRNIDHSQKDSDRLATITPSWFLWLVDSKENSRFFLPICGVIIFGLDWILFSQNAMTLGVATPLLAVIGFFISAIATFYLQRTFGNDRIVRAIIKALCAGVIVGIPWPIAGTLFGAWILAQSGLDKWKR